MGEAIRHISCHLRSFLASRTWSLVWKIRGSSLLPFHYCNFLREFLHIRIQGAMINLTLFSQGACVRWADIMSLLAQSFTYFIIPLAHA